jgi:hypothetical protein
MEEQIQTKKKFNFKDKRVLSGFVIALIAIFVTVGGFIFYTNSQSSAESEDQSQASETTDLPQLSPEDIGMVVTVRKDNKAVMFELKKADDIKKVEYTIEYEAEVEGSVANQGIFGEMNIAEDGIKKTDFREFGTCSAGKCRYDNVTSDVTITLKVVKKDGKEYQVTKVVKL